jgi:hypothetical protein
MQTDGQYFWGLSDMQTETGPYPVMGSWRDVIRGHIYLQDDREKMLYVHTMRIIIIW